MPKKEKVDKSFSYKKGKSHDCLGQEVSDVIIMICRKYFQHSPVIVAPGELLLHIPAGLEASQSLDYLRCLDCNSDKVIFKHNIVLTQDDFRRKAARVWFHENQTVIPWLSSQVYIQ